ncbi:hypothetical protein EVAR_20498_1 [Eumeta japonica]|uniref:ascorbate ferrireductase (transmembrane) n=1 Tax=Eumeta variegata TaxID=151549 RepID=A0A4C1YA31_EUMVA|nr:hypothetical protein EVAR_20498_1 [Eumeta japonica]
MPPNFTDAPPLDPEIAENGFQNEQKPAPVKQESTYQICMFVSRSMVFAFTNVLIGMIVGVHCFFAFRNGLPLNGTSLHVLLCVIGYYLLMAQAILALSNSNSWLSSLKLVNRRRVHWVMQSFGAVLAIGGSILKMLDKEVNFETVHGKLGFAAMVFTFVSLLNGLSSLYAYELRKFIPGNLSKISHILFGTVAFLLASICLAYGNDKNVFRNWATPALGYTMMAFTAALNVIVLFSPLLNCCKKSLGLFKK